MSGKSSRRSEAFLPIMKLGVWDVELLAAGHSNICFFSNDGLTVRQACVILDRICKMEAEQSRPQ